MTKTLKIQGVIGPETLEELARQIGQQAVEPGDRVDVLFNSPGGVIDVAFRIAQVLEELQDSGITLRAVAEGKVFSSAVIPFLAVRDRVALRSGSFLVHKAKYELLEEVDLDKIEASKAELTAYTQLMDDYYADHGIPAGVRRALHRGEDLLLADPAAMIAANFIRKVSEEPARLYNKFRAAVDKVFPAAPQFTYIHNSKTIVSMTKNQVRTLVAEAMREAMPELVKGLSKVVNARIAPEKEELGNESSELTPDELAKLAGVLSKTPAEVGDDQTIRYLVHPAGDIREAGFVLPLTEAGKAARPAPGELACTIGGETFVLSTAGGAWCTLTPQGAANEAGNPGYESYMPGVSDQDDEFAEQTEQTAEPATKSAEGPKGTAHPGSKAGQDEPEKPGLKTASKAPEVKNQRIPVASVKLAQRLYRMFEAYGPGCTGK